jgi:hypothetical protein
MSPQGPPDSVLLDRRILRGPLPLPAPVGPVVDRTGDLSTVPDRAHHVASGGVVALLFAACDDSDDAATTADDHDHHDVAVDLVGTSAAGSDSTVTDQTSVDVFFSVGDGSDCAEVGSLSRAVADDDGAVAGVFGELVAGPTEEEIDAGAGSFFSDETGSVIRLVT